MARCKLTNMNLRNIRRTKEYQAILIDLVKLNVVSKSAAETVLGYKIPAGLLSGSAVIPDDDDTGNEGGNEGGGNEGSGNIDNVTLQFVKTSDTDTENGQVSYDAREGSIVSIEVPATATYEDAINALLSELAQSEESAFTDWKQLFANYSVTEVDYDASGHPNVYAYIVPEGLNIELASNSPYESEYFDKGNPVRLSNVVDSQHTIVLVEPSYI